MAASGLHSPHPPFVVPHVMLCWRSGGAEGQVGGHAHGLKGG